MLRLLGKVVALGFMQKGEFFSAGLTAACSIAHCTSELRATKAIKTFQPGTQSGLGLRNRSSEFKA